jgi:transcriptional regulator with XRE-family HTH domain
MDMVEIGAKITKLREAHDATAASVAAAAGITRSYLSRLENGRQVPSLVILDAIAQHFRADLGYFFETNAKGHIAVDRAIDDPSETMATDGTFEYRALCTERVHKQTQPFMAYFRPHSTTKVAAHDAEYFRYVISGSLILHYAGEQYKLAAGDAIYYDAAKAHKLECDGDVVATALTVFVKAPIAAATQNGLPTMIEGHS